MTSSNGRRGASTCRQRAVGVEQNAQYSFARRSVGPLFDPGSKTSSARRTPSRSEERLDRGRQGAPGFNSSVALFAIDEAKPSFNQDHSSTPS